MSEKFQKYAWDQTKKSITIYVPYEGADTLSSANIQCTFGERSVELRVYATANSCRELKIPNLCKCIDAGKSKMALKSDRIQLKLIKLDQEEWSALTDEIDQKKAQRAERVVRNVRFAESQLRSQAHGDLANASTQELLADMYANATDEERASLRSAAAAGAKKREENRQ